MEKSAEKAVPNQGPTETESSNKLAPGPKLLTRCPVCNSMVTDLEKHMRKARHDPNWAAALKVTPALPKVPIRKGPEGYACPFCAASLPTATQLKSHVVGSHGGRPTLDTLQFP